MKLSSGFIDKMTSLVVGHTQPTAVESCIQGCVSHTGVKCNTSQQSREFDKPLISDSFYPSFCTFTLSRHTTLSLLLGGVSSQTAQVLGYVFDEGVTWADPVYVLCVSAHVQISNEVERRVVIMIRNHDVIMIRVVF